MFQGVRDMSAKYEAMKSKLNENETHSQVLLHSKEFHKLKEYTSINNIIFLLFSFQIWNGSGNIMSRIIL
jgi:hypothetical protein